MGVGGEEVAAGCGEVVRIGGVKGDETSSGGGAAAGSDLGGEGDVEGGGLVVAP